MQPVGPTLDDPILIRAVTERQGRLVDLPPTRNRTTRLGRKTGRKALVAPLLGESTLVGTLLVSDPLSDISTFEAEDLKLFETLANHTAIALENGQLEQSLEQLGRLKEELHHQALHDPLTGLANRSLFTQVVASRLEARGSRAGWCRSSCSSTSTTSSSSTTASATPPATRCWWPSATASARSCARRDMAARLGGDEFAVLLRDTPDMKASMRVANRLTAAMGPLFEIEGRDVNVRASVGVAAGRPGIDTRRRPAAQRRRRDVLGQGARQGPGGRLRAVDARRGDGPRPAVGRPRARHRRPASSSSSTSRSSRSRRAAWSASRRSSAGSIPSAAGSARTTSSGSPRSPTRSSRSAAGCSARPAGRSARGTTWSRRTPFTVSVNISARQLAQPDFVDEVLAIIREAGVAPTQIVLEMTETSMLQDSAATRDEAAGPAGRRHRRLDRRLRDRLLVAQLPPALPGHDAQDRPRLRRRRRPRRRRLGAGQRDRRARPGAPPVGHRRGRRAVVAARPAADPRLRVRPGLLLRPSARPGRRSRRCWPTAAS